MATDHHRAAAAAFLRQNSSLRESAWAAEFSDMSRQERQRLRGYLETVPDSVLEDQIGELGISLATAKSLRRRWLMALDSLAALDYPEPDKAARRVCADVLRRAMR